MKFQTELTMKFLIGGRIFCQARASRVDNYATYNAYFVQG
jgi:hypothetical protein